MQWDKKDDISDNIYNVMKKAGGSDDSLYLMPWNIQVLYVYYRPSIFEKAGVEVPKTMMNSLRLLRSVRWIQTAMERPMYTALV